MKIHFERSGGFLGRELSTSVDTNDLPPEKALRLLEVLEDADFFTLPDRFKHIRQIGKHQGSGVLSASLALGAAREKAGLGLSESDLLQTNEQILRALRQMARLLVRDNDAADDLVEATLRRAIAEAISMAPEDRPSWLADLMERVWIAQRG